MSDEDLKLGTQIAFSKAHSVTNELITVHGATGAEIGHGLISAAIHAFKQDMEYKEIAKYFYEAADNLATKQDSL